MKSGAMENQSRISTIARACRLVGRMCKVRPEVPRSHLLYYQMLADYYTRIQKAKEEGGFVAAHTIFFPAEILYAMNIIPMHTELTAWMTALFSGSSADLLATAAEVGMAPEICSPYRVLTGALAKNALAQPDTVLWTNLICDNAGKGGELVMHMTGCSGFFVDCPFQKTGYERAYLKRELQDMIAFLEKESGHRMDWNKLSENIARADRQIELFREINGLRRTQPSPFPPQDFLKLFTADCLMAGQPEVTKYLETVKAELLEKIETPRDGPSKERFRIMNIMMPPVLLLESIGKVSAEYGAVSVADPFFCGWGEGRLDPRKPLESVIQKMEMHPVMVMYGPLNEDILLKRIVDGISEYHVDGAIYYAHIGCRQSASIIKLIKDTLNSKGVPVLILDSDIIDVTITPEEELHKKLRQFFELLEDR
jgi:benzoyl-CoA reductase/2-hydroxyglutaryl-CoA dehydratase subunit BcrC/BadD/HgdB